MRSSAVAVCLAIVASVLGTGCGSQTAGGQGTTTSSAPPSRLRTDAPVLPPPAVNGTPGEDPSAADQEDWAAQTGDAWDLFNTGYLAGWQTGCDDLFGNSPDGNLYENDVQYTVSDCEGLAPVDASLVLDAPSDVPVDPESVGQ